MNAKQILAALLAAVLGPIILILVVLLPATESTDDCAPGTGTGPPPAAGTFAPLGSQVKPVADGTATFTSGYGMRWGTIHQGIDLAGQPGTPIYAYADGVVTDAGPATGFGHWIVIDHNIDGQVVSSVYGHMFADGVLVQAGQTVRAGQHIANMGFDGGVDPPGPAGSHLHFELWPGGRNGGASIDPKPAFDAAPSPGGQNSATPAPNPGTTGPPAPATPGPGATAQLAALPAAVGSEEHYQVDTIRVARAVHAKFPQIQTIGGWRADGGGYDDHPSGRAADIMIPNYGSGEGIELGNAIVDYLLSNAAEFHIEYLIWRQEYIPVGGERNMMEDRGGDTANHYDHVHVTTIGGGYPNGSETYTAPDGGSGAYQPGTPPADCVVGTQTPIGDDLAVGTVPPEYVPWLTQGGRLCPQIRPSLMASQLRHESQFNPQAVSSAVPPALGAAQILQGTFDAPGVGADDDGNGRASPFDIGDAVMAQGRYLCQLAAQIDGWIADGTVTAPNGPTELYLAAYNAGPGAIQRNGGFPTDHSDYIVQTRPYVDAILADEPAYADAA